MSSDESEAALPWRSSKVTDFFQNLDALGSEVKTSQAK